MKTKFLTMLTITAVALSSCGGEKKEEKKEDKKEEAKEEVKEEAPAYEYTYQISEEEVPAGWAVSITTENITLDKIEETLGSSFSSIHTMLTKGKKEMAGAPMAMYLEWVDENSPFTVQAGIPVNDSTIKVKAPMTIGKTYGGRVLKTTHMGNYKEIGKAHMDIDAYLKENGLTVNGAPWEVYVTDPGMEKDTAKWQTDIYYPVK